MGYTHIGGEWENIKSDKEPLPVGGSTAPSAGGTKPSTPAVTEKEQEAKKELVTSEKALIEGDCVIFPNPRIRSGKTIKLSGLGANLSGEYYIKKVTYNWNSSEGLTQTISVRSNAIGSFFKGSDNVNEIKSDREAL